MWRVWCWPGWAWDIGGNVECEGWATDLGVDVEGEGWTGGLGVDVYGRAGDIAFEVED